MSEFWQEFAQKLLLEAIPLLIPVVIVWIGKALADLWLTFKANKPELAWEIKKAAEFAIKAAEQVGLTGALVGLAESKLDYAIEVAEKWLSANGIKNFDLDLLRAAIESELKDANFPHVAKPE